MYTEMTNRELHQLKQAVKLAAQKAKTEKKAKPKLKFHVCIPLYHGIPKEKQSGWTRMGEHGVQEWDNTTNILEYILRAAQSGKTFDKNLYCGTCGRIMVKGRNSKINPFLDPNGTKTIQLV